MDSVMMDASSNLCFVSLRHYKLSYEVFNGLLKYQNDYDCFELTGIDFYCVKKHTYLLKFRETEKWLFSGLSHEQSSDLLLVHYVQCLDTQNTEP